VHADSGRSIKEEAVRNHGSQGASIFFIIVAFAVMVTMPARAESPMEPEKGWQFDIVPYIWASGFDATLAIGDVASGGVDASFSDLVSDLNMAAMGVFEARNDRWGVLFDGAYFDLSATKPTTNPTVFGDADVDFSGQIYTGLITYRAYQGKRTTVDALAGARYVRMDTALSLTGGVAAGRTASGTVSWWDWMAGARIIGHPGKNWSITGYVDIGGGGSNLDWDAVFGAAYAFNKTVYLPFGYRYLDIDYGQDIVVLNMAMGGPYVGVGFHW
jgi:hypothetical protein